ncbi:MAG: hypothetical protein JRF04_01225 [Deltaproteobacteria bacterium]|nr:hypothetical protein [Deltaproteobacteria bacterium]
MSSMQEQKVQDEKYQPRGMETGRTLRHALLALLLPMGNGAGGAGRKYLCIMWLTHHLGGFFFPVLVRQEDRLHKVYLRLQRLRTRK